MPVLLSTAYIPPLPYFTALSNSTMPEVIMPRGSAPIIPRRLRGAGCPPNVIYLEACENYQKQSWRNRCRILTANGPQDLSFPIIHEGGTHSIPITQVKIDYSTPWVRNHERAISSAYGTSAFYAYYRDHLFDILESRPATLWELNSSLLHFFLDRMGMDADIRPTTEFLLPDTTVAEGPMKGLQFISVLDAVDLREVIHPKRPDDILARLGRKKPYFQVFSQKYGFVENLSILDLLFNEGPEARI